MYVPGDDPYFLLLFVTFYAFTNSPAVTDMTFQEVSLYAHLVDILTFFVRQHLYRSRNFIHGENLTPRVAQLLTVPQKHLKLSKFLSVALGEG